MAELTSSSRVLQNVAKPSGKGAESQYGPRRPLRTADDEERHAPPPTGTAAPTHPPDDSVSFTH